MADSQLSAPSRAPYPVPASGVVHVRTRHTARFTVVGNHLAQHPELSLLAIGLAVHIQSLPDGARVDIKTLAARFSEGETRIAAALRELEAHGYLKRTRERLPSGRIITRTVFYDRPGAETASPHAPSVPPQTAPPAAPARVPAPLAAPPLPSPTTPDPERHGIATALLAGLRRHDQRLILPEREVRRLAPTVEAWLERGISPTAVRQALTNALPDAPRHPAALLAHRLTELLPPPLPACPAVPPVLPFQTCDGCERAFRAPGPGLCRDCRATAAVPQAA